MPITITVDLSGIKRLQEAVSRNAKVNDLILEGWTTVYFAYTKTRFDRLSKHGSEDGQSWQPLAQSTIDRRRKGKKKSKKQPSILRDTGALFGSLSPMLQGGILATQKRELQLTIYFDGGAAHPEGKATLREIAIYHQLGDKRSPPRPPQRIILVVPPQKVLNQLANVAKKAVVWALKNK